MSFIERFSIVSFIQSDNHIGLNLSVMDMLGPAILSFIEKLLCLWRSTITDKGPQSVSFIQSDHHYCLEPLSNGHVGINCAHENVCC